MRISNQDFCQWWKEPQMMKSTVIEILSRDKMTLRAQVDLIGNPSMYNHQTVEECDMNVG